MGTGRIEAFSDGVFAIAITLLILEIRVPAHSRDLGRALLQIWPSYLAYATSFFSIGVMWVNHHAIFRKVARSDHTLLFLNNLLLLVVAFIPFPTRLVAEYLREGGGSERAAAIFYGSTSIVLAVFFNALWRYVSSGRRLISEDVPQEEIDDITRTFNPGIPIYAAATAIAFVSPLASIAVVLAIAVFFAVPPSWLRRKR